MEIGTFTFLGTGASGGIPVIGCDCAVCRSSSPYNKRLRAAGLLRVKGKTLLIDVGPDIRTQLLPLHLTHLNGLILTHTHFDHIAGIDDLRIFYFRAHHPLPCLVSKSTLADLEHRYFYLFSKGDQNAPARFDFHVIPDKPSGKVEFLGVPIRYMTYLQGSMEVKGYRFGDFAYVTDIREYPETIFEDLEGVKILVLGALRETPSKFHFHLQEAVTFAAKVNAEQTWFTHMAHELDHDVANRLLPKGMQLAYDGLQFSFNIN